MPGSETLKSYGFDTSLREMPGPNRTFESPESHLPLPGNISYYQELYPKQEDAPFPQSYIVANKRLGKGLMAVSGIGAVGGLIAEVPYSLTMGVLFGGLGFLHHRFFVEAERRQQGQFSPVQPTNP